MKYLFIGFLLAWQTVLAESNPFPAVAKAYLVQVNGNVLWQKQANQRLPPASLTKLMLALIVLERSRPDSTVSVSKHATLESGTRLGLKAGSIFTVKDLLRASLQHSANDACQALADELAGDEKKFVALMNARAQELNLTNTHFENACGHDAKGHYSSAADLAELARLALAQPLIAAIATEPDAVIESIDHKYRYRVHNQNALIGHYPGINGLKTGYTPGAGKCLIASASRRGKEVMLVMLNAPNRWWDAVDILNLAFENATPN